jgi:DNA-3-methyladenine glycosylase I
VKISEPGILMSQNRLFTDEAGTARCWWCQATPSYMHYHDHEWGFPVDDDHRLFEKICLEGFQAGLSWLTILNKRENFRAAFAGFDFYRVAGFDEQDVQRLLQDAGIVRHRGKIEAVINNARRAQELVAAEGSLASFFWRYEPVRKASANEVLPDYTDESKRLSRDLKKLGWRFVGPTTVYAFMQAMGLVNDHLPDCDVHGRAEQAREAFARP